MFKIQLEKSLTKTFSSLFILQVRFYKTRQVSKLIKMIQLTSINSLWDVRKERTSLNFPSGNYQLCTSGIIFIHCFISFFRNHKFNTVTGIFAGFVYLFHVVIVETAQNPVCKVEFRVRFFSDSHFDSEMCFRPSDR